MAAEVDTVGVNTEEVVTIVATTAMLVMDELTDGGGAAVLEDAEAGARPSVTSGGFALVSVEHEEGFAPAPMRGPSVPVSWQSESSAAEVISPGSGSSSEISPNRRVSVVTGARRAETSPAWSLLTLGCVLRGSSAALGVGSASIDCSIVLGTRVTSLKVDSLRRAVAKSIDALSAALTIVLVAIDFWAVFMTGVDVVFFGD